MLYQISRAWLLGGVFELVSLIMDEKRLTVPRTPTDALSLFHTLIDDIMEI